MPRSPQAMTGLMRRRAVNADLLYVHYLAIGGWCERLEIDAWLHQLATLPPFEAERLAHALWELVDF